MNDQEAPQTLRQYDERHPLATWQRLAALERRVAELERALFEHAGQIKHVPDAPKARDV